MLEMQVGFLRTSHFWTPRALRIAITWGNPYSQCKSQPVLEVELIWGGHLSQGCAELGELTGRDVSWEVQSKRSRVWAGAQPWLHPSGWGWGSGHGEWESRSEQGAPTTWSRLLECWGWWQSLSSLPPLANPSPCLFCTVRSVIKAACFILRNSVELYSLSATL